MHRLAVILRRLGESDVGSDRLVQAVRVLRKLVSSCPDEGFPLGAFYKQSLANALSILGSRVGDPTPIREALKIRSNIVTVFRSENDTLAMEQNITDTR